MFLSITPYRTASYHTLPHTHHPHIPTHTPPTTTHTHPHIMHTNGDSLIPSKFHASNPTSDPIPSSKPPTQHINPSDSSHFHREEDGCLYAADGAVKSKGIDGKHNLGTFWLIGLRNWGLKSILQFQVSGRRRVGGGGGGDGGVINVED